MLCSLRADCKAGVGSLHYFLEKSIQLSNISVEPFLVPGRKPRETYKISIVRVCVRCVSGVMDYLRNRSEDFSETRREVGGKKCKKRSTDAFLRFWPVLTKAADLCEKKPFLAIFGSFCDFAENQFRGFFLNPPKMCQQNSSAKVRYF